MNEELTPGLPDDDMSFSFRKKAVSKEIQENNWKKVEDAISNEVPVRKINWLKSIAIAASVTLIVATSVWYLATSAANESSNEYKTGFAKTKKITLPDGSKVILNANSALKLSADWSKTGDRQVWLDGEAYFEVEKSWPHTKNLLYIQKILMWKCWVQSSM